MIRSVIKGCGGYLPARVLDNHELARMVDTSDQWIFERTGIRERRIAAEGETTSMLAIKAADAALKAAGRQAGTIDLLILATTTPDLTFPGTSSRVQAGLGMSNGAAFDLQAACSGFIYGLAVADNFIRSNMADTVLLVGSEVFSRIIDWQDRATCVLFGDGAGACVIERHEGKGDTSDRGILTVHLHSDGHYHDILCADGGPGTNRLVGHLRMQGREVFRHAVTNLAQAAREALEAAKMTPGDIDWVVPHQANKRIIDSTARHLNLSPDRIVYTVERHGNTSAASIPLALSEAVGDGRLKERDVVLMEAMGGGLTWGSAIVRW
jgi:3-oxoacyl-[acyl-carrier-protein] synthase-3